MPVVERRPHDVATESIDPRVRFAKCGTRVRVPGALPGHCRTLQRLWLNKCRIDVACAGRADEAFGERRGHRAYELGLVLLRFPADADSVEGTRLRQSVLIGSVLRAVSAGGDGGGSSVDTLGDGDGRQSLGKTGENGLRSRASGAVEARVEARSGNYPGGYCRDYQSDAGRSPVQSGSCVHDSRSASVDGRAGDAHVPRIRCSFEFGRVVVLAYVSVTPTGDVDDVEIYRSSNNMAVDQEALRAIRRSAFAPRTIMCMPTYGDYLYKTTFDPGR